MSFYVAEMIYLSMCMYYFNSVVYAFAKAYNEPYF